MLLYRFSPILAQSQIHTVGIKSSPCQHKSNGSDEVGKLALAFLGINKRQWSDLDFVKKYANNPIYGDGVDLLYQIRKLGQLEHHLSRSWSKGLKMVLEALLVGWLL